MSDLHDCDWNIYLRLANCWMSHFGASFFFLVFLCYCWCYSQSLGLKCAWLKWSQFLPTQYLRKLSPLLFHFPSLPLDLNHLSTKTCKHTRTHFLCNSHIKLLIPWGPLFHTGWMVITSQRTDTSMLCLLRTCRGASPLYQRPRFQSVCMSPPPAACVLMNATPFNSNMKMLWKEMPTLIPNMPWAALSLCYSLSHLLTLP